MLPSHVVEQFNERIGIQEGERKTFRSKREVAEIRTEGERSTLGRRK
jgi:hypothetical protein